VNQPVNRQTKSLKETASIAENWGTKQQTAEPRRRIRIIQKNARIRRPAVGARAAGTVEIRTTEVLEGVEKPARLMRNQSKIKESRIRTRVFIGLTESN
jgi:hypothetical protein